MITKTRSTNLIDKELFLIPFVSSVSITSPDPELSEGMKDEGREMCERLWINNIPHKISKHFILKYELSDLKSLAHFSPTLRVGIETLETNGGEDFTYFMMKSPFNIRLLTLSSRYDTD